MSSMCIPPGPAEPYDPNRELLDWLSEQFNRFGDIYRASIYGTNAYVISAPAHVEHVLLRNWQNYVKGQAIKRIGLLLGKGLMVSEGEFWIRQRRMIQPAFHRQVIGTVCGIMEEGNRALLARWEQAARAAQPVNVTRDLSHTVLGIILKCIFGDDFANVAPHFDLLSTQPERSLAFADAFRPLARVVIDLARERRAANASPSDFLGLLMQARDRETGQVMPDAQLAREIMTLVVAGHETTASVLNWTWYLLSGHRSVEGRLGQELDALCAAPFARIDELPKFTYTRQILEEVMRLYPPGWLLTRRALMDDRLGEYFVPAGTEIYISPYLIQRHPALWDEPDRFIPERFSGSDPKERTPLAMLPFSIGPRNCIGEFFARVEMQIHLMIIAKRLRLRYAGAEPKVVGGVNLLSQQDLIMTAELRN